MSKTAIGKKDGRKQERNRVKSKPKDGGMKDFFYMSEAGVATPMLALKFSRSGRITATALEQKGLTQYGVKFIAGFIQQKALKDAATKALEGIESIGQESPVGSHQASGDIESAVRTLKARMRATRFGLESRQGRQLAHDAPILMWIPTYAGDTTARFRKGPDGMTP